MMSQIVFDAHQRIHLGVAEPEDYAAVKSQSVTSPLWIVKVIVVAFLVLTTAGMFVTAISEALQ